MRKRPGVLLPSVVGVVALLGFGWVWIVLEPDMASPTSTIVWLLSELALALALAVPAICLFFVIRAVHIRRIQAREATGPDAAGIAKARDLLWSLSHGLLPQTQKPGDIPTDATEQVFLSAPVVFARHTQSAPKSRRMLAAARSRADGAPAASASRDAGWATGMPASVAASDRRILILLADGLLLDIPYSDITEVHVESGQVVLRLRSGAPVLITGDDVESIAVLAVWGSVGESALRRHPALAALRT